MAATSPFALSIERIGNRVRHAFAVTVAIPAKDEEERIARCLDALAAQEGIEFDDLLVVILLNNCRDKTLDVIHAAAQRLPFALDAVSVELPPSHANAGWARRLAMDHAADSTKAGGFILTTDADSVADPSWISATLCAFEQGADAVAGFVTADWDELCQLPEDVLKQGADEWEYQNLAAELESKADPLEHDPWPRHNQNCGASTAIRAALYRDLGGLPPEPVGEDRALFDKVRERDGLIRHCLAAKVVASARTVGRASGGMADALKTRGSETYACDEILEPAITTLRRNRWRYEARQAWEAGELGAWLERRNIFRAQAHISGSTFWPIWLAIEAGEPRLARIRMRSDELPRELRRIRKILVLIDAVKFAAKEEWRFHRPQLQ